MCDQTWMQFLLDLSQRFLDPEGNFDIPICYLSERHSSQPTWTCSPPSQALLEIKLSRHGVPMPVAQINGGLITTPACPMALPRYRLSRFSADRKHICLGTNQSLERYSCVCTRDAQTIIPMRIFHLSTDFSKDIVEERVR